MDSTYYKKLEPFWGVWYIDQELGEGSYGRVFKIKRDDFGQTYTSALKIISFPNTKTEVDSLKSEGMDDLSISKYYDTFAAELVQEFSLMSKIKGHSNIVSYEDHMTIKHENGIGYDILIRMELLTPLNTFFNQESITEKKVIQLGIDMCKALEICSKYNIIHRDIKPENVFVSELGDYKLGDFGVSRIAENATQGMSVKGTISYMAPEVYKGQPYNSTVDIYSLGIMLYKLCNNNRGPFLPPAPEMINYADRERAENLRMNGTPLPNALNASSELMAIIRKASAYNSKERYASASEMRDELESIFYAGKFERSKDFTDRISKENIIFENGDFEATVIKTVAGSMESDKTVSIYDALETGSDSVFDENRTASLLPNKPFDNSDMSLTLSLGTAEKEKEDTAGIMVPKISSKNRKLIAVIGALFGGAMLVTIIVLLTLYVDSGNEASYQNSANTNIDVEIISAENGTLTAEVTTISAEDMGVFDSNKIFSVESNVFIANDAMWATSAADTMSYFKTNDIDYVWYPGEQATLYVYDKYSNKEVYIWYGLGGEQKYWAWTASFFNADKSYFDMVAAFKRKHKDTVNIDGVYTYTVSSDAIDRKIIYTVQIDDYSGDARQNALCAYR